VRAKIAENSAQAFDELISTMRTASMRGFGGSSPNDEGLATLHAAPEFPLSGYDEVLIERVGTGF